jgi:hypothetical protein
MQHHNAIHCPSFHRATSLPRHYGYIDHLMLPAIYQLSMLNGRGSHVVPRNLTMLVMVMYDLVLLSSCTAHVLVQ